MKRLLLFIFMAFYAISTYSQAIIFVQTPVNTPGTSTYRAPNGTSAHTTFRAAFIIPASELNGVLNTNTIIKRLGFVYSSGVSSAAGGNLKIYLQNTTDASYSKSNVWSTILTGMTQVYDGSYSLPVGTTTAATTDIGLNSNFTYTGGGLYVAYDYLGSQFATTPAVYNCDVSSAPGSLVDDLSSTTTPPVTLTQSSNFRPTLLFGINNPYQNDIMVSSLDIGFGKTNRMISGAIKATVQNKGAQNASNIQVSLNVTGANTSSQTFTIPSLNAGASTQVSFNMVNTNVGSQNIVVSVPNDENNSNNSMQKAQQVGCGELAFYNTTDAPFDGIGFNTGAGILAVKYLSPAVGISISGTEVHINPAATSVNKQVGGVLLNANGVILAESPLQTITNAMLGTKVVFNFPTAVNIPANTNYYVALKQMAGTPGYFPVGTFAPADVPAGRVYSFFVNGGTATEYTNLGTLMVGALLSPYATISSSTTGIINSGTSVTFTASPNFSQYIFKVNGNAMQTGAGNTYTYTPLNNDIVSVEAALNGCSAPAASITMQVDPSLPIRLYSFTVQKEQQKVKVNWQTLTETNNKEFIVGRSTDGIHYTEIAKVPGAINSLSRKYYQVVDATPAPRINYYKLEQLDLNGQLTEIGIKALDFSFTGNQLSLYPNPVKNVLNINFVSNTFNQLQLSDVTGKVIYQAQLNAQTQAHQINLSGYPVGVYILLLKGAQQQLQQKVIKD
ncbi:T9SS type A sorting domain-containing protein [Pedobacter montanisoli]|uniref:T9SS type A sorting domain-containing protein n=1 Tax=Pedobacter montanisoli TaxID=2923277 RepID=A0ABS9ZTZ9_9SPHI|nr:T9SS type A sorting domain-containing protein [Pedobacter montanisoli]MCJ0741399.1 T9SS type A sorting domain-containing protein [Pedobacter montanisoli]